MGNVKILSFAVLLFASASVEAQEKTEELTDSTKFKPYVVFSLGGGITRFMGDVQNALKRLMFI